MWAEVGAEHGPTEGRLLTQSTTHVWPRAAELTFARLPICPSAAMSTSTSPPTRSLLAIGKALALHAPLLLCHCRCQCQCLTPTLAKALLQPNGSHNPVSLFHCPCGFPCPGLHLTDKYAYLCVKASGLTGVTAGWRLAGGSSTSVLTMATREK